MSERWLQRHLFAAVTAAMRGDVEGARVMVATIPATQLRTALVGLVVAVAAMVRAQAPGREAELVEFGRRLMLEQDLGGEDL